MTYVQPVLLLVIAAIVYGIWARNRRVIGVAAVLLFLWSWRPAAVLLSGTLEKRYPIQRFPASDAEAIVVLSGGIYPRNPSLPEDQPRSDTYLRTSYAGWLYRNWRPLPVVVSGGAANTLQPQTVLAEIMRRLLMEQGVPSSMIWVEGRSHSTYENAVYSAELLRGKGIHRIVLVTEAYHMLRSQKAFEKQGLTVVPAACAYQSAQFNGGVEELVPSGKAIEQSEAVLHEWLGLLWYRISGKI